MKKNDDLGIRMKTYEKVNKNFLIRRTPVIIRIDRKGIPHFYKRF